ncbi:MAG: PTS sugar transporter subunit IIA [bacterium]|nr:PTS sugar transporter subunit IIA [bacterium]
MIGPLVAGARLVPELQAQNKDGALKELIGHAREAGAFPEKSLKKISKLLSDREAIGSTGLGNGVAVPHVKAEGVGDPTLVLARCKSGLEWQAIDGRPVHIIFMLVSPADDPERHLGYLRWISTLARSTDFRRFLLDAADDGGMRDLLEEMTPKDAS